MGMAMGPVAPMMTDQKSAGRSRAAQRQYLRGVDQKIGADMVDCIKGEVSLGDIWRRGVGESVRNGIELTIWKTSWLGTDE